MRLAPILAAIPVLIFSLVTTTVYATEADELQRLLDAGQDQEAYNLGRKNLASNESEPAFDLAYGTAAYRTAHHHEAMFALERVVIAEPENMKARYILAKTYYAMGNFAAAQREFKIVQANNPPADVALDTGNYLTGLKGKNKQPSLLGYVEALVGHDSNINRSTTDSTVAVPPFFFSSPLSANGRQQSSMYRTIDAHGQYFQPLIENLGLIVKGSVSSKDFFSDDEFDEDIYNASAMLNKKIGKDTLKIGVFAQSYQLSGSSFSVMRGIDGGWHHDFTNGRAVSAGLGYNDMRYHGDSLLNVDQKVFQAAVHQRYDQIYHSLGLMRTNETAFHSAGDHNARNTSFLFYDVNLYVNNSNSLQGRLLYSKSDRDAKDPVFSDDRDDEFLSLTAIWQWRYNDRFMLNTRLGISNNDSDIELYDYDRRYLETGVRYTF